MNIIVLLAAECAGIWLLFQLACWAIDYRARRRWQQTTAARTEADARADVAAVRRAREIAACNAIWDLTPHDIPHQTRRTEGNQ